MRTIKNISRISNHIFPFCTTIHSWRIGFVVVAVLLFCFAVLAGQTPERRLCGYMTVGAKKLPLIMKLRHQGEKLIGTYQYVLQGLDIHLLGLLTPGGMTTIEEFSGGKISTGKFQGKYDNAGFEGTWVSPDEKKRYPVALQPMPLLSALQVEGVYKREEKNSPAEIRITGLPDDAVNVAGEAFWYGKHDNVHTGDINGNVVLSDNSLVYDSGDKFSGCRLTLTFMDNLLYVTGDKLNGTCGGMNVTFNGVYKRKPTKK